MDFLKTISYGCSNTKPNYMLLHRLPLAFDTRPIPILFSRHALNIAEEFWLNNYKDKELFWALHTVIPSRFSTIHSLLTSQNLLHLAVKVSIGKLLLDHWL